VLEFDGKAVRESTDLTLLAAQAGVNKTVTVASCAIKRRRT